MAVATHVADQVIGAKTRSLDVAANIDGFRVTPGKVAGKNVKTLVAQNSENFSVVAVMSKGQKSVDFGGLVKPGQKLSPNGTGGFLISSGKTLVASIDAPWARDATGKALPTSYTAASGVLTQHVDTAGAVFPVVADPKVWIRWNGIFAAATGWQWKQVKAFFVALIAGPASVGCVAVSKAPSAWRIPLAYLCGSVGMGGIRTVAKLIARVMKSTSLRNGWCYKTKVIGFGGGKFTHVPMKGYCTR